MPKPLKRPMSGVAQWLACWAHNPKVRGSKPRSAIYIWPLRQRFRKMDTLGIEPRASRMLSGCDTTTPQAQCTLQGPRYSTQHQAAMKTSRNCNSNAVGRGSQKLPAIAHSVAVAVAVGGGGLESCRWLHAGAGGGRWCQVSSYAAGRWTRRGLNPGPPAC